MGRLEGQTVVVGGGTGSVGEGLTRAFLTEGARVFVPYRTEDKRDRLIDYVDDVESGELICLEGDVGDEASIQTFRNELRARTERVDLAVASIGGWYYGYSLHRMPFTDWQRVLHSNLTTHFLFMRAMLSLMHDQKRGTYVMINGGASKLVAPESGMISILAAAQKMMTRVLVQEAKGTEVEVYAVVAFDAVKTRSRNAQVVDDWLAPEDLGHYIVRLHDRSGRDLDKSIHTLHTAKEISWIYS
jgi:NAD(P)-dependent dehydrogenase (short-subunit alcohol dehydrogenase family)